MGIVDRIGRDGEGFHFGGRESEFEIAEGAFEHSHESAGTGLFLPGMGGKSSEGRFLEFDLDAVSRECALVLVNEAALAAAQDMEKVVLIKGMASDTHGESPDEFRL